MKPTMVIFFSVFLALISAADAEADQQIIMDIEGMTCKL